MSGGMGGRAGGGGAGDADPDGGFGDRHPQEGSGERPFFGYDGAMKILVIEDDAQAAAYLVKG